MANVKLRSFWSRSIHVAVAALFIVSLAPSAWSDETATEAAPPATTEMPNEAPTADSGMMGAGSPEEAPPGETTSPKKTRKAKKAAKKKAKHAKKKSHVKSKKKSKKKKKRSSY